MEQIIVLPVGAPGSGKGKIAEGLKAEFGFSHISTSDLLTRDGQSEILRLMGEGRVAPDDLMEKLLEKALLTAGQRIYLDSLRSVEQVCWLAGQMPEAHIITLHLLISKEEILRRIDNAPQTERGARADDSKIAQRLQEFELYSPPMFPALRRWTHVEEIDAEQSPQLVFAEVCDALAKHGLERLAVSTVEG